MVARTIYVKLVVDAAQMEAGGDLLVDVTGGQQFESPTTATSSGFGNTAPRTTTSLGISARDGPVCGSKDEYPDHGLKVNFTAIMKGLKKCRPLRD
jgi:hypothetical protein